MSFYNNYRRIIHTIFILGKNIVKKNWVTAVTVILEIFGHCLVGFWGDTFFFDIVAI